MRGKCIRAKAMANVAVVINPEMVVIGGGVAQAGRVFYLEVFVKPFTKPCKIIQSETIQLRLSELGVLAGIQGSAAWGMKMKSA